MIGSKTYLIPELFENDDSEVKLPSYTVKNSVPVVVKGFKLNCFLHDLDFYPNKVPIIARKGNDQDSCFLYSIQFNEPIDQIPNYQIEEIPEGKVLILSYEIFSKLDAKYTSLPVFGGNWLAVELKYHQYAALYHLGILPLITIPILKFDIPESMTMHLHRLFQVTGNLEESLTSIYSFLKMSLSFFGIPIHLMEISRPYCFGGILHFLETSATFLSLYDSHPLISFEVSENLKNIFESDDFIASLLKDKELDFSPDQHLGSIAFLIRLMKKTEEMLESVTGKPIDSENLFDVLHSFQKSVNLSQGYCDFRTLNYLETKSFSHEDVVKAHAQNYLYLIAGIPIQMISEPNYPTIRPFPEFQTKKHDDSKDDNENIDMDINKLSQEINCSLQNLPDPSIKGEWFLQELENLDKEFEKKSQALAERLNQMQKRVETLSIATEEASKHGESTLAGVKKASSSLKSVYTDQQQNRNLFVLLRDSLFKEQKKTRNLLILVIILLIITYFKKL